MAEGGTGRQEGADSYLSHTVLRSADDWSIGHPTEHMTDEELVLDHNKRANQSKYSEVPIYPPCLSLTNLTTTKHLQR